MNRGKAVRSGDGLVAASTRPSSSYTFQTHLTEFDEVDNGLRFPSRVLILRIEHEIERVRGEAEHRGRRVARRARGMSTR